MPAVRQVPTTVDIEGNPQKKLKNQTALHRLKEKIREKKANKAAANSVEGAAPASDHDSSDQELLAPQKKKEGRWERRQRQRARLDAKTLSAGISRGGDSEDDLLKPVDGTAAPALAPLRKKRLRIGKDGTAKDSEGRHVFFAD